MCFSLLGIHGVGLDFLWHCDVQEWCFKVCREGHSEYTAAQREAPSFGSVLLNGLWAESSTHQGQMDP